MRSQLLGVGALLVFVFGSVTPASAFFKDVDTNSSVGTAVTLMVNNGIIEDGEKFYPSRAITKMEFLVWALKNQFFDPTTNDYKHKFYFTDVPYKSVYAPFVSKAIDLGVITKTSDIFSPQKHLTREEALRMIFIMEGVPVPVYFENPINFSDTETDSQKALVNKALALSFMSPISENYFGLQMELTRGETAKMLYNVALMSSGYWPGSGFSTPVINVTATDMDDEVSTINDVWNTVLQDYYLPDSVDRTELMYSALEGMVKGLGDIHSVFQRPLAADSFVNQLEGEIEGIGAYIDTNEEGESYVLAPIPGAPAEKAGVQAGDVILKVDDTEVKGETTYEVISKIKGAAGTSVKLTLRRGTNTLDISVVRAKVTLPIVTYKLDGQYAIITISEFTDNVGEKFDEAANKAIADGARKIIIDLRNNPGGYLDGAAQILNRFYAKDETIFKLVLADDSEIPYISSGTGDLSKLPVAVLINGASASASEVLALSLREGLNAKIVGEKSYGKGSAQRLYPLLDGSSLKLSVAKWESAKGTWLNHTGMTPDIEAKDDSLTNTDECLQAAENAIR